MCGIIGGIRLSELGIRQGLDRMHHRGPDDFGLLQVTEHVVFAHKRLSILDLSSNGRQPMQSADGVITVTFNGEIYNFPELKQELARTYSFVSQSDTEVLVHGYREWGIDGLLRRIQGMFAFAVYDRQERALYLARDRFGKKPLYYASLNGKFAFASTLPALLSAVGTTPELDPLAIDDYLTYMCVPGERTMFQGMHKLPPATYARLKQDGSLQLQRYWDLSFSGKSSASEAELVDELDEKVRQAVKRRMLSDVPLGAFLSGGVDSSLIVGVMASLSGAPVKTITMGFEEERFDERPYARLVSHRWGTDHHEEVITPDASAVLPELVFHAGEPLADSSALPTYYVSKLARKHLTVILNGDGGDELFAGYARPMVEQMAKTYRMLVPAFARSGGAALYAGGRKPRFRPLSALKQLLEAGAVSPRESFVFDRALRSSRSELYTEGFMSRLSGYHPDELYQAVWDRSDAKDSVDRLLYGDMMTYLPDELLVKMDTMTMAHSLEARSALLDTELAEFSARIPSRLKTKRFQTKYLLKTLAKRYVPEDVLFRPKKGFNMPMSAWLRGDLSGPAREVLLSEKAVGRGFFRTEVVRGWLDAHQTGRAEHGQKLWSLLMLELWCRMFVDGDLRRSDTLDGIGKKQLILV